MAYIEDVKAPLTTPGRGKRMKVLRIGDMVGDFILKEIGPDMIVLGRGSEVMTVDLADLKGKRQNSPQAPNPNVNPAVNPNTRRR